MEGVRKIVACRIFLSLKILHFFVFKAKKPSGLVSFSDCFAAPVAAIAAAAAATTVVAVAAVAAAAAAAGAAVVAALAEAAGAAAVVTALGALPPDF